MSGKLESVEKVLDALVEASGRIAKDKEEESLESARTGFASELLAFGKRFEDAWKVEKNALDEKIVELLKENTRLCAINAPWVQPGDKVDICGIRMTVTLIKVGFDGYRCYHLVYFSNGELKGLEFDDGELSALEAQKVE